MAEESGMSGPDSISSKDLLRALKDLAHHYVILIENGRDRIVSLGGQCDPVDVMERGDPYLRQAREAIAKAEATPDEPPDVRDALRRGKDCAEYLGSIRVLGGHDWRTTVEVIDTALKLLDEKAWCMAAAAREAAHGDPDCSAGMGASQPPCALPPQSPVGATPETENEAFYITNGHGRIEVVRADFARRLEAAVREARRGAAQPPGTTQSRRNRLRALIDDAWNAATESQQVPSIEWADEIIDKWIRGGSVDLPEWRPIESAPMNGKWILLWWPHVTDAPFVGFYTSKWRAATNGDSWVGPGPTHWMPLPTPPTK